MNNYSYGLLISAVLLTSILLITSKKPPQITPQETLSVGMMSGWAPFMTINNQGNFEGFDVDIAQEIASRMNKKLIIQDFGSLAPCFLALEQNKVSLMMSGLDITTERQKKLTLIPYTGETVTSFKLCFWKTIPDVIKTIDDIKNIPNAQVCAEPGSAQEKFIDSQINITKKPIGNALEGLLNIRYGKSLTMILEPTIAKRLQQKNPDLITLDVPLPQEFQVFGMGIALKKDAHDLAKKISAIIANMKQDGTLSRLEKKWELENNL